MSWFFITVTALILLGFAALAFFYVQNGRAPMLGVSSGQLSALGARPNAVSSQTDDKKRRIDAWPMKDDLPSTVTAIKAAVATWPRTELVNENERYLRFEATTALMGWRDDLEFWINTEAGTVEMRSASRAGYSDRGLNRKRIVAIGRAYAAD